MSGFRYFLSIVVDYSRRVWVHFLRHKNEAFSKFKEWKQLESGIARHLTVAETPQQNGLAERMNRTHFNKVRCLLIQSGLPDSFWPEATVTAAYLINRSPSTTLEKKTPMDLWSRHPANYKMLRIFGCVAYSHVNQGKLKPRAIKCIFPGDVVFNESLMYKDTLKGAGAADSGKEVEFEVELQGSRVEPTVDPHTGENPGNEDEEQDEEPQQQNLENYVLTSGSKVDNMAAYAFAIAEEEDTHEPIIFQEAINSSEKDEWVRAMKEKMNSLKKNHTWKLVDQPPGQKLVSCKWLYKIKEGIEGVQKPRVILSLTACEDYELEQLDVKTAFLHGNLEETIYMSNGFSRNSYDSCVYFKEFAPCMYIYLLLYVDDMLIACKSKSDIEYIKGLLRKEFNMKELGPARKILGMEIVRDRGSRTLKVSQSGYVQKILNNYRMDNGKSVSVPLGAHFKVSLKDCPSSDWDVERMSKVPYANVVVEWILKYLKGTADVGLVYGRDQGKHVDVDGFVDADYAKDPDKEAEYMALTKAVKRTEHINVRYHFIREIVESKEIEVARIGTKDNGADAFTKVVLGPKFKYCMKILGVGAN
ncbi:retrotransposon protein, putative, ty1-copia subclass [Tanacetum coccineum]